ncbi:hypothetical protein J3R74_002935 [Puniceicoccus vermicola]
MQSLWLSQCAQTTERNKIALNKELKQSLNLLT